MRILTSALFSLILFIYIMFLLACQWKTSIERVQFRDESKNPIVKSGMKCFGPPKSWSFTNSILFENVLTANVKMVPDISIFFHETSCFQTDVFDLNTRYNYF